METFTALRTRLANLCQSVWTLSAIKAAIDTGIAAQLTESRTLLEVARACGSAPGMVEGVLDVLVAEQLATRAGDGYVATAAFRAALAPERLPVVAADLTATFANSGRLRDCKEARSE